MGGRSHGLFGESRTFFSGETPSDRGFRSGQRLGRGAFRGRRKADHSAQKTEEKFSFEFLMNMIFCLQDDLLPTLKYLI